MQQRCFSLIKTKRKKVIYRAKKKNKERTNRQTDKLEEANFRRANPTKPTNLNHLEGNDCLASCMLQGHELIEGKITKLGHREVLGVKDPLIAL